VITTAAVVGTPIAASASVSATPEVTAGVTGKVYAIARLGNRTFIGGNFTAVGGVPRRNAAAILANGTVDPNFIPNPNGTVRAIAVSAQPTRVFLGGKFTQVGGVSRARLAAVNATTGAVVRTWYAAADGPVYALAAAGPTLYAGGSFTKLGGLTRHRLAAVSTATRVVQPFNPFADWTVRALVVSPGHTRVYAVGGFHNVGGAAREGVAELQATTGAATTFAPTRGGVGIAVALSPDGVRLYFSTTKNDLFAYRPVKANTVLFRWRTDGDVQAIAASATEVYLGGHFAHFTRGTTVNAPRMHLASIGKLGPLTAWNPGADGNLGVWAAAISPTRLLIGGEFLHIGAQSQPGFARFVGTP
jgi:hypothetical protein